MVNKAFKKEIFFSLQSSSSLKDYLRFIGSAFPTTRYKLGLLSSSNSLFCKASLIFFFLIYLYSIESRFFNSSSMSLSIFFYCSNSSYFFCPSYCSNSFFSASLYSICFYLISLYFLIFSL